MDKDYKALLKIVKKQIGTAQIRTITAANKEMLLLYWKLGQLILIHQANQGWGAKVIDLLSKDIKKEFPKQKGLSVRNLKYMRKFASEYPLPIIEKINKLSHYLKEHKPTQISVQNALTEFVQPPVAQMQATENQSKSIVQQLVAQTKESVFLESVLSKISWSHHIILMDKEAHLSKRIWYMHHCIEHGISRNILAMHIESNLFERQVESKKITNFKQTLPPSKSDFANYLLKDPYIFDFVQAKDNADERNIEEQLANQITKFLLELGKGFAFVARQMHFEVGGDDFYADLVFYHTRLKCYVIVELKAREFKPGDASQLNFYVNVANDVLKSEGDNETIGLLLCKGKNEVVAEYSLKGLGNALGVSEYQISNAIPDQLKSDLPQIEEIENELKDID
ncbi:MAG TPA: PDDEXK nuclease domain-containing protein [Flavobacteriaceae bacterium]|nr:PDDEXK nuclease domain-containing protein [Flavobacteriaceae bacterium]